MFIQTDKLKISQLNDFEILKLNSEKSENVDNQRHSNLKYVEKQISKSCEGFNPIVVFGV